MSESEDLGSLDSNEMVDLTEFSLNEVRLRYQEEEGRRKSAEAKIGTVLTVDALLVSVVSIFSTLNYILVISMVLALLSVYIGMTALWVRDYTTPGLDIDDYLQYIENPPEDIQREILKSYMTSITGNEETDDPEEYFKGNRTKNDEKFEKLDQCLQLTLFSLGLILMHPIMAIF